MKKILILIVIILTFLVSCTIIKVQNNDEVYYRPKDGSFIINKKVNKTIDSTKRKIVKIDSVKQKDIIDNYNYNDYSYNDYYDYFFASRIRRFHNNIFYNNYYSDYYTNLYWYNYNPIYWGINMNWSFGYPYYRFNSMIDFGYYGYYDNFWNPYWGYDRYYQNYNQHFNYQYDRNYYSGGYSVGYGYVGHDQGIKTFYGPRRDNYGSNGPTPNERTSSFTQRYNNQINTKSTSVGRNLRENYNTNIINNNTPKLSRNEINRYISDTKTSTYYKPEQKTISTPVNNSQRSITDPQRYAPVRQYQTPTTTPSSTGRQTSSTDYSTYRQASTPSQSYTPPAQTYSAPTQTYSSPVSSGRESPSYSSTSSSSTNSSPATYSGPRR